MLNVSPDPNASSTTQDNNFVAAPIDRNRTNQFDIRVDHQFSQSLNMFGRYSFSKTNFFRPGTRPGLSEGSSNDTFGTADLKSQALAAGLVWVAAPALVSETRFGYAMGDYFQLPPNFGIALPGELIGLKNAPTDPSICGGLPVFNFTGNILRRIGRTTSVPQFQTPRSMNVRESIAWTRGDHALRFGGELLNVDTGIRDVSSLLGQFDFNGRFTGFNNVWENSLADLLLGFPSRYQQDSSTTFEHLPTSLLPVPPGRLESQPQADPEPRPALRVRNTSPGAKIPMGELRPGGGKFISAKSGSLQDEALIKPDRNNFAPRFGFAYSATPKTVVRGAWGIFYNHTNRSGREGLLGFNPPFIFLADAQIAGSGALRATDALFRLQDGIPTGFVDTPRQSRHRGPQGAGSQPAHPVCATVQCRHPTGDP